MTRFDDETLMAFVDGALGEPEFSAIAAAVETDAELAARVDALSRGGDLARLAFGAAEPVPAALKAAVEKTIDRHEGTSIVQFPKRPRSSWMPALVAASLAAIIAGPLGYFLNSGNASSPNLGLVIGQAVTADLSRRLDTIPSGEIASLGSEVSLRPIATFGAGGDICREFELEGQTDATAIACRSGGEWRLAVAVANTAGDSYSPASAPAAIEAWLAATEAGEPLSPEAERDALAAATRR